MRDFINFLQDLGLTEYEAKVMHSLLASQEAEAPLISRNAQVPKTRVYDVLERLVSKGLLVEISGRPKRYKMINAKKAFATLLDHKRSTLTDLELRSESILETVSAQQETGGEKTMKVKDVNDFYKILANELATSTNTVHAFSYLKNSHSVVKDALRAATRRNVKVKLLDPAIDAVLLKELGNKITSKPFAHGLHAFIIDNKKTVLAVTNPQEQASEYHFTIWHDNKPLAKALSTYFNHCWNK
jgi:HTH-type transcriptional regulator, sugar sensing transcriptional regulator